MNTEGTQEEGKQSRCNLGLIRDRGTCAPVALVRGRATEASGIRRRLLVWVTTLIRVRLPVVEIVLARVLIALPHVRLLLWVRIRVRHTGAVSTRAVSELSPGPRHTVFVEISIWVYRIRHCTLPFRLDYPVMNSSSLGDNNRFCQTASCNFCQFLSKL